MYLRDTPVIFLNEHLQHIECQCEPPFNPTLLDSGAMHRLICTIRARLRAVCNLAKSVFEPMKHTLTRLGKQASKRYSHYKDMLMVLAHLKTSSTTERGTLSASLRTAVCAANILVLKNAVVENCQ
jgi:hypothetical protein